VAEPYSLHASVLSSAAQGDSEQLLRAVQACPEALYARSERGYTAAHLASWAGHVSTLESNSQKSSNSDFISKLTRDLTFEKMFQAILIHMDKSILAATDVFGQTAFHLAAAAGNLVALQMMYSLDATLLLQATRAGSNAAHLAALRYVTLLF
jgi:ankyrin repeat protein